MIMSRPIFEYENYKKYLKDWIASRPRAGHGDRSRIAEALRCHVTYVSQVLSGDTDFSPEQAEQLTHFLGLSENERDFFLLLVHRARAGSASLRAYYQSKIQETVNQRMVLKNRLEFKNTLTSEDRATYYSSWQYSAVHLLSSVPELNTKERIGRYLDLPLKRVNEVLEFLLSAGLVIEERGRYSYSPANLHLGSDSPFLPKHHMNWRLQAIRALVRDSPEEALCSYCLDLFEVGEDS